MSMAHPLLARGPAKPAPAVPLLTGTAELALTQGRVHEACGPARRTFAMWLAAQTKGPIFWISLHWTQDRLNSDGVSRWINPARLVFISPNRAEDLLWTMEETLRSGSVALSIADLPGLPNLTQVRRMHLAAEAGGKTGTQLPLGVLLTPGQGGAAGVETRWHLKPHHRDGQESWHLERARARTAACKSWAVERSCDSSTLRIKTA